jgi:hypothetical protein
MEKDDKEEHERILRYIGEALRGDMKGLTNVPSPGPILLQVLHLIRREQERGAGEAMNWEELPDDLRQLLERLKAGDQGPTEL